MVALITIVGVGLQIIGGATVLLNIIAPLTKNNIDNKVLNFLKAVLSKTSLNVDDNKIIIDVQGINVVKKP